MTRNSNQSNVQALRRVAVIGGGLGGLGAAFRCALAGDRVDVFDASPCFGGSIQTTYAPGFVVEQGAEGFPADSSAVRELARDLGLESELIEQRVQRGFEFDGKGLVALEPGEAAARLGLSGRSSHGAGVATFRLGMQQLVDALVERLRRHGELHANRPVESLSPSAAGWKVRCPDLVREFDAVILATSGKVAAALLGDIFGSAARDLAHGQRIASLTISLAYPDAAISHPLDGTGFVTCADVSLEGCVACTFTSSKFSGRAPANTKLLRLFFRPTERDLALPSEQLVERARSVMERVFPGCGAPLSSWEARWPEGFPLIDHVQQSKVTRLEEALDGRSMVLAGSAFHGSGIDAAVRSADAAARKLHSVAPARGRNESAAQLR